MADDAKMLAEALEWLLNPWAGRGYSQSKDQDARRNAESVLAAYKTRMAK